MTGKVYYDNGKIKMGFDSFRCDDGADMEILCDRVNELILQQQLISLQMDISNAQSDLNKIKELLQC